MIYFKYIIYFKIYILKSILLKIANVVLHYIECNEKQKKQTKTFRDSGIYAWQLVCSWLWGIYCNIREWVTEGLSKRFFF